VVALLLACGAGICLSLLLEKLVKPAAPPLVRNAPALALHCGLFSLLFVLIAVVLRRPFLSAVLVLALQLVLVLVSNAKWRALREPLVYSDVELFSQALRHPRLYLPYLELVPGVLAILAFAAAVTAGVMLENAIAVRLPQWTLLGVVALGALAWGARPVGGALSLEPEADVAHHGLVATLWLYWMCERASPPERSVATPFSAAAPPRHRLRPHVAVVQSESFFDPRLLHRGIADGVLGNYDALRAAGASGRLAVPGWGAYTMRTEFAFLSGIGANRLGVHRFNPYRRFARQPISTLAWYLRTIGYRTVCVHPYPATFFGRDRVIGNLGFDEFLDLRVFTNAAHAGPFVADSEVARKVIEILDAAKQPVFVFAITMENHGPLHLERATREDAASLYREAPPAGFEDLTVYLRHLRNADAMFGELAGVLGERGRDGILCAFGDHVPSMPRVYSARQYADSRTDYLIWRAGHAAASRADLPVEALAANLLRLAGLAPA